MVDHLLKVVCSGLSSNYPQQQVPFLNVVWLLTSGLGHCSLHAPAKLCLQLEDLWPGASITRAAEAWVFLRAWSQPAPLLLVHCSRAEPMLDRRLLQICVWTGLKERVGLCFRGEGLFRLSECRAPWLSAQC